VLHTLHPPRPHHHDSAGDAQSLCLDGKSLQDTGWSKVVMVEPTEMKPVKLIGRTARH
jgi:hypothetical protein